MKEKAVKLLGALQEERERLPEYSPFGDNNWKSLDTQIEILNKYIDGRFINYSDLETQDEMYELSEWLQHDCDDKYSDIYIDYCE